MESRMPEIVVNANKTAVKDPEELRERIAIAAYFLSEQRGFAGDYQLYDWLEAESNTHHIYGKPVSSL